MRVRFFCSTGELKIKRQRNNSKQPHPAIASFYIIHFYTRKFDYLTFALSNFTNLNNLFVSVSKNTLSSEPYGKKNLSKGLFSIGI